jgi:hypothetical protein
MIKSSHGIKPNQPHFKPNFQKVKIGMAVQGEENKIKARRLISPVENISHHKRKEKSFAECPQWSHIPFSSRRPILQCRQLWNVFVCFSSILLLSWWHSAPC